jgi:hypothetical protein
MTSRRTIAQTRMPKAPDTRKLLEQYECGPIQFTGTADALYERHLLFDNVVDPSAVGARERYEAVARSVRDVLSQRWVRTEKTYERLNPKRVHYLSMEFLYNPPHGGPADTDVTVWIQKRANTLLRDGNVGVRRLPYAKAIASASAHQDDFVLPYVRDLESAIVDGAMGFSA